MHLFKRGLFLLAVLIMVLLVASQLSLYSKTTYWLGETFADHSGYMVRHHELMDGTVPNNAVIFLGDSSIHGLYTEAVVANAVNYGIGGLDAAGLLINIPKYKALNRANKIVLDIGANDVFEGKAEELGVRLEAVLEALPAGKPVFLNSMMPTNGYGVTMQEMAKVNDSIRSLCEVRPHCHYLNTWPFFLDEAGAQNQALFHDDQVHLNSAGYRVWIGVLKQALEAENLP